MRFQGQKISLLRQYIRESVASQKSSPVDPTKMALALFNKGDESYAVAYDVGPMKDSLENSVSNEDDALRQMSASIVGMVEYAPAATGPCYGAYEILKSAVRDKGQGMGTFMYSVVMSMAKSHTIMSDRRSVSGDAENMWQSMSRKSKRGEVKALKFDDEGAKLTPDPNDDCMLNLKHRGDKTSDDPVTDDDYLNHAFQGGSSSVDVNKMRNAHDVLMADIGFDVEDPEGLLQKAAINFFRDHYAG